MELQTWLAGTDVTAEGDFPVRGIAYDSRRVRPGDLFVALPGRTQNSDAYAKEAEKKGAVLCIGERVIEGLRIPQLHTENARRTLAYLYANANGNPEKKLKIIGITGTNGKTSTAFILKTILSHAGYKTALIGTQGAWIGETEYMPPADVSKDNFTTMTTPDPDALYPALRDMEKAGVEYAVMEVSSHALALEKVSPIPFALGIFTNLSPEHLDFHGNMENYLAAKARLFSLCKRGLLNADSPYAERMAAAAFCPLKRYGVENRGEYTAVDVHQHGIQGSDYVFRAENARFRIKVNIPGKFTVYNTLAAASAAWELGVDLMTMQNAVYALRGIGGRLERLPLGFRKNDFSVFIDYAHTPFALENLLECVANFRIPGQRIVTVMGCGGDRDREKRPIMGKIATGRSDYVIFTSDNPRTESRSAILADILSGVGGAENYRVIEDRREAIRYAVQNAINGDIILLVGKGHEQYEIDETGLHPFSEREIVEAAIEE